MPGARSLASYRKSWLRHDLVAGLVLSTLLVPQGMAYAELAGLPAITGLYTTVICLIGYAVFGPSRVLVLGPDSSLGPMIAAVVLAVRGGLRTPGGPVLGALSLLLGYAKPFAGALGPPLLVCVLAFWLFWLTGMSDTDTRGWGSAFLIGGLVAGELCVLVGGVVGSLVRGVRRLVPGRAA